MTQFTIIAGCAGAGKTERLLKTYGAALERARSEGRFGTCLWLSPTQRIQKSIVRQVVARQGAVCFSPNILTFDQFARKILESEGVPDSPISPVMKRLLIRRIASGLQDQGELRYFRPIAGTTGFLDIVSNFISELKREEIWPEEFVAACRKRKSSFARRDLEIGLIYSRYQEQLAQQNWYDNEGRFWLARNALDRGARGEFANVGLVVVDGFADFTQTQYEILGILSRWIDQIIVALPVEPTTTRPNLFSKPSAAIQRIREQLDAQAKFQLEWLSASGATASTVGSEVGAADSGTGRTQRTKSVQVIADRLFSNPRFLQPSSEADGLEIIAATGPASEWEGVAHRIKALLRSGREESGTVIDHGANPGSVQPQDIVIGLRTIADDGPRLRDYLRSAGLPVWCEAEVPFTASPMVRAVSSLLQLELEDWPYERLLSVLDSSFFQPNWPELASNRGVRVVAAVLRQLQLGGGRETILRVVGRAAGEPASDPVAEERGATAAARVALPLLTRLSRSLDQLRRSHTLADWADVLASIGEDLGWTRRHLKADDSLAESESRDWDLLQRILRTAAEADQKLSEGGRARSMKLPEFCAEMSDLLSHETLKAEIEPGGSIRILGMEQIRNLEIPHLFLLGMTENSFPMSRSDDCLFSEAERREFLEQGVILRHRSSHQADEMFLFYSVVTRARKSLTLSYPAVNLKGQPVFSSPYVTALTTLFTKGAFVETYEGQLNPVPTVDRALTPTDVRLAAMVQAHTGHPELFRAVLEWEPLRKTAFNSLAACDVAHHRFHQHGFTPYEGRLELPQNQALLQHWFGPRHQFSATELESYAKCPFQFWLSTVLRIAPVDSPEEGTDFAARGTLLHDVLAELLKEGFAEDPDALRSRFHELVSTQLDRRIPDTDLQRALIEVERLILLRWGDAFAEQHSSYTEQIGNVFRRVESLPPEIPFGRLPDAPASDDQSNPEIRFGNEETGVKVRGRIDRVDCGTIEGQNAFLVIDYKTGQRPSLKREDMISGRSIQLALYLTAVRRLGLVAPDAVPFQMGYWALKETGYKPGLTKKFKNHAPLEEAVVKSLDVLLDDLLPRLAEGIRSGNFIVENNDDNCTGRCQYRTVCRVNQLRPLAEALGKRSPAPVDPCPIADE
ncbi:PD-(D/E)XK nuclease family protein [Schlesneria sp.]|uniref:PD-(D/E)XK nuclease family protein n=1 Tax=Schlesneria sp. TaxID=2762018 RepID=UPI002EDE4809